MVEVRDFELAVGRTIGRSIDPNSNASQNDAVMAPPVASMFVVAGPGSGKTTVLALRALKLILADEQDPSSMLITTFTRRAAAELSSRILSWGDKLVDFFLTQPGYSEYEQQIRGVELNRLRVGTLDGIIEEALTDFRAPGSAAPVIIEEFAAKAFMISYGILQMGGHNNRALRDYLRILGQHIGRPSVREMSQLLLDMRQRFCHDQSDMQVFHDSFQDAGKRACCAAISAYSNLLSNRDIYDFARLEEEFLIRATNGSLDRMLDGIKFVMVDEYQDTNLLQEQIYFEMGRRAIRNGGSLIVVGDDDQSLYRFRGATLDLFVDFPARMTRRLGAAPRIVYLSQNYRSTRRIVDFCNQFVSLDQTYQNSRVPNKPISVPAAATVPPQDFPVLGMFRNDSTSLAVDLANFISDAVNGNGVRVTDPQGQVFTIQVDQQQGGPGDIAVLFSSPEEMNMMGQPRLPFLLRRELQRTNPPIRVYNPRGQNLGDIDEVMILCGAMLECLDPQSAIQNLLIIDADENDTLNRWRMRARQYAMTNPPPNTHVTMATFIQAWQNRTTIPAGNWDAREVPLLGLAYKLLTWIPTMRDDIEGLVRMEAICRTISQAALVMSFQGNVIVDQLNPQLSEKSIKEIMYNVFVPLATNSIEINEDLLETLPSDRVNIMSIHQAKGLEFPLVIVDVGSDFRTEHWRQAFKRHPRDGGKTCRLEDEIRPFSQLGLSPRPPRDRAFDDLYRLYYEAYSRAQDVLMLVGLDSVTLGIQNVATGWDRSGNWVWGRGLPNLLHI